MSYKHGAAYAYRRALCRCDACRQWNARTMAEYRARRLERGDERWKVYGNRNGTGWARWARNLMQGEW